MKRKLVALMMAAAMVIVMLAGCGNKSDDASGKADNTEAASEGESKGAQVLQSQEATGEDVTIRVALWDYSNTEYYKTMIDGFQEAFPNIEVEVVEFTADEYEDVVTTQLSGHQDFDVVFMKSLPGLASLINMGHIYALDDLVAADSDFDADAYSGLVDALSLDGHTYALPFRYDNNLIYYNKDLFDEAGVAYPEDGMTIEDYHELAAQMTSGTGNDKVYGAHIHTWASCVYMYPDREGTFVYDDPTTYEALIPYYTELLAMQDEGLVQDYGALKSGNIHYSGVMYNEQAAMLQTGTWFINMLCENATFNWGVCSIPSNEGLANEVSIGGVTPVCIGAYAQHPAEAWQFINYVCGEEGASILAECGILPGYSSDAISEIFDNLCNLYEGCPENLSKYITCDTSKLEAPLIAEANDLDNIFTEEHSAIMTKSVSIEEGVQNMIDRATAVLEEE